jgi:prevent-host-death family protein
MKRVALSAIKDQLSKYLRMAEKDRVLITRHGKPVAILIGFKDEDEWFEYQLENDPRFLERVERARTSLKEGKGVSLEDIAGDA